MKFTRNFFRQFITFIIVASGYLCGANICSAQSYGAQFHIEGTAVELQLDSEGNVKKRVNATYRLDVGNWAGEYHGTIFLIGEIDGTLMNCGNSHGVKVCLYSLPSQGDLGWGMMFSAYRAGGAFNNVDILRVSKLNEEGKSYIALERYDLKSGTSEPGITIFELDKKGHEDFKKLFYAIGDNLGYSEHNTIAGGVQLK